MYEIIKSKHFFQICHMICADVLDTQVTFMAAPQRTYSEF